MTATTTLVATYNAYDVIARATRNGAVEIFVEDLLCLDTDHMRHFQAGSVVRYAQKYDQCPIEAVAREQARGHELYWINALGASITSHKRPRECYIVVSVGMLVKFEGRLFTITKQANNNLGLKEAN